MHDSIVEVKDAVVHTFEGERVEVRGGAYLTPEAYLHTMSEVERLRTKAAQLEERSLLVPSLLIAAGLIGAALGYWLGRRSGDE